MTRQVISFSPEEEAQFRKGVHAVLEEVRKGSYFLTQKGSQSGARARLRRHRD